MVTPEMALFDFQLVCESGSWPDEDALETLVKEVISTAALLLEQEEQQPFPDGEVELSLVFTDDEDVRGINAEWRGMDKPTNVLSFPAFPVVPGEMPGPMLGDIVLAFETVEREAAELDKSFNEHLTHLLTHGFLHLLGYDHIEKQEAELMEGLETRILAALNLSDPYQGTDPV